ncbi:PREDICTED: uncharacterized protein LOC104787664, partial [Camelina sativa]|uniref:Uncharacterized protein LOC104787664 n=1 Tax=Camelina sativa TaxID=90675 RepID=A0ABM0Z7N7_CAMSA
MEQRQVNKMCPGRDVEKMALSDVDNLLLSGLEKERKKLRELLGLRGCIAIVGPEQSGKKVLLRSVCEVLNIQINVVPHKNHEPQDSYLVHHAFSQKSMNSLLFFDDETLCKWGAALVDFLSYPRSKKDIFVVLCLSRPYVLDKMVIRLFGQRLILVNPPAALIRTLILKKILQEKDIEVS